DPGLDMRHAALAALAAPDPRAVGGTLTALACAPERAPYVARGILGQIWSDDRTTARDLPRETRAAIAHAMLDDKSCPGAVGLMPAERARLLAISEGVE
uniref:hypothetical protein n=1 Tax=Elioraea rosea TaxID=2492390 RepID=UPI0013151203